MSRDTINRLQSLQLEIMLEVKRLCEKHNLRYFLVGGTLLGAVRHEGFIPWDDDLDIAMPREDYDRFIQCCATDLDAQYYLHSGETDPEYWLPFAKVRKNGTFLDEETIAPIETHKGIFIDIFPLDNAVSPDEKQLLLQSKAVRIISSVIYIKRGLNLAWTPVIKKWRILLLLAKPFSIKTLAKIQRRIMTLNNKKKTAFWVNFGSNYSCVKQTIPVDRYIPAKEVNFDGELLMAPNDCDYILTRLYGDYMVLPPVEKREGHHAVAVRYGDE